MTQKNSHWTWPPLTLMKTLSPAWRAEDKKGEQCDLMDAGSFALGHEGGRGGGEHSLWALILPTLNPLLCAVKGSTPA